MIWKCLYCGREREDMSSIAKKRKYCSASCQLKWEYENGKRDKFENGIKAREVSQLKMKENNWLNSKESRDKLKEIQQTEEYKLKERLAHLGEKNGMFGKIPWNYVDGKRNKYGNADRGFNWKEIKKKIKERDNFTCQDCGKKEDKEYLQVHHIIPYKIFQDNSEDNLITLCPKCHMKQEYSFVKVKGLKLIPKREIVYNFSVDEDESYVAEDIIVHNCRSTLVFISKKETEEQKAKKEKKASNELDLKMKQKELEIKNRKEILLKKLEEDIGRN